MFQNKVKLVKLKNRTLKIKLNYFFFQNTIKLKKINESSRVIDRGTSAHFCVSDQYLISKVLRIK